MNLIEITNIMRNTALDAVLNSAEQNLTVEHILINFLVALILGAAIYVSYRFSHSSAVYSSRFNVSLLMLTLITTLIMNVIGNNIALSLGMVGALSIIRFRTAVKDPRDTAYIFWCISVGIACGVSYYTLALIGTAVIFVMMLVMGSVKSNERYLIIVHCTAVAADEAERKVMTDFKGKAMLRVKNMKADSVEMIYEVTSKMLAKLNNDGVRYGSQLLTLDGVKSVDLVCQNEEMAR